jgi:3-oxo-5alpha-steroid 4-dehydrogenase
LDGEALLRTPRADDLDWDETADVVVVGFGGAGACAALAAREEGAEVLVLDRLNGGGATALSGGVYYGGGTSYQREAGFEDTPEEMYRYLKLEVDGVIEDDTLRRFCNESAANLNWLVRHGVRFQGSVAPDSAPYMAPGYHLYFSGNERVPAYAERAKPAPRGHIALGEGGGSAGQYLFAALERATMASGASIHCHTTVSRLVIDETGAVVGVEARRLPEGGAARRAHQRLIDLFNMGKGILHGLPARLLIRNMAHLEATGDRVLYRARRGVVLATGGFIRNTEMVARHLPRHVRAIPLGAASCDGSGVLMGAAAGAKLERMDSVDSSRNLLIPKSFMSGVLLNREGERFIAEDSYAATIGREIVERHDGKAWLVLDAALHREAWAAVAPWRPLILRYRLRALAPLMFGRRRGRTLEALAAKCGMPADRVRRSVEAFNAAARTGADPLGRLKANLRPLGEGPYYAIDCATDSAGYPPTSFTLGGLAVDEASGQVLDATGQPLPGLFAAGRVAVGLPSNFYVSGLSIADCVFSGRRAGAAVAGARADVACKESA